MNISIRKMTEGDWPAVVKIYQEGINTGISTFQTCCPSYEEWNASHLKACRLIAFEGNNILGWSALSPVSSRCVYKGVAEISIYIAETARSKGVGTSLLNAIIKESENEGIWTLQSGIIQNNTASLKLHKKCGFREVGYRERIAKDRLGNWRNTVLMECRSDTI